MRIAFEPDDLFFALQLAAAVDYNTVHEFRHSDAQVDEVDFTLDHNGFVGFHGHSICRGHRVNYNEEDLTNALAVYVERRFGLRPDEIGVAWDVDGDVFTANVDVREL